MSLLQATRPQEIELIGPSTGDKLVPATASKYPDTTSRLHFTPTYSSWLNQVELKRDDQQHMEEHRYSPEQESAHYTQSGRRVKTASSVSVFNHAMVRLGDLNLFRPSQEAGVIHVDIRVSYAASVQVNPILRDFSATFTGDSSASHRI